MKGLRTLWLLFKLRLSHMMVLRFNFFGAFFVDSSMFAIELMAFNAIYGSVDSIGGWSRAEMIVFVGTFSLINALSMFLVFFGLLRLPELIVGGGLDHYLTKPIKPLLRLSLERINPGSALLIVFSLGVIGYGARMLPEPVPPIRAVGYIVMVLLMSVLWYDMELILRCIPFFVRSASDAADQIEGGVITLCFRIPGTLLRGGFKLLFYFVMPYGIMATMPTQLITGTLSVPGLIYGVCVAILFTALALGIWRAGLRRYDSASS